MKKNIILLILIGMYILLSSSTILANSTIDISQYVSKNETAKEVLQIIEGQTTSTAEFLVEIGGIISPSGQEQDRAEAVAQRMRDIGLQNVEVDENPNVMGFIPGKTEEMLIFVSTLDDLATVAEHQKAADKPPYIEGDKVVGPGTNTSLTTASMLAAAHALIEADVEPYYTLLFASVAQEETGLHGMRSLYEKFEDSAYAFIDILGDGRSISYGAMGIFWRKVIAEGPGGHTLSGGVPNVNQAIGRAVDQILSLDYPEKFADDKTRINISILNSGKVFNHKPESGWFSIDIRSLNGEVISNIENDIREILENVSSKTEIDMKMESQIAIPGGQVPGALESNLLKSSIAIANYLGIDEPELSNASCSNINVPIGEGTLGIGLGGSRGGERGKPEEWASIPVMMNTAKHVALLGLVLEE